MLLTDGTAVSRRGLVTSPHRQASETGRRILGLGGNAIEAAVAMGAVLAVTYPHFCGLGGDAVWMLADREARADCLLAIGQAAAELPALSGSIPARGPLSALTSAALVEGWSQALEYSRREWDGRLSLGELLADAIRLAEEGFATTPSQVFWLEKRAGESGDWPGFAETFDRPMGETFRQPALARTLRDLERDGLRSFYEGPLAERIADGLAAAGSPLRAVDLQATRARWVEPLRLDIAGRTLLAPPPPTQGATTLAIMGILERLDWSGVEKDSADHYHRLVEAVKQAFLMRGSIADPDHGSVPIEDMLDPAALDRMAGAIDPQRALPWPATFREGDTVFLAAVDGAGRAVGLLQSLYFDWGSGVLAGDTGILWQNRGAAFSTDPAHPNVVAPGKRPFYTLNPGIALRDGRPNLIYGTQGADGQPQTLAAILSRALQFGSSPHDALSRPRFLLGRTFSDSRDSLKLEGDIDARVVADLARRGHEIARIDAQSPLAGQAGLIEIHPDGTMHGMHDPRSDGAALGMD